MTESVISPGAAICGGAEVRLAVICENAVISEMATVCPRAVIGEGAVIGKGAYICEGVLVPPLSRTEDGETLCAASAVSYTVSEGGVLSFPLNKSTESAALSQAADALALFFGRDGARAVADESSGAIAESLCRQAGFVFCGNGDIYTAAFLARTCGCGALYVFAENGNASIGILDSCGLVPPWSDLRSLICVPGRPSAPGNTRTESARLFREEDTAEALTASLSLACGNTLRGISVYAAGHRSRLLGKAVAALSGRFAEHENDADVSAAFNNAGRLCSISVFNGGITETCDRFHLLAFLLLRERGSGEYLPLPADMPPVFDALVSGAGFVPRRISSLPAGHGEDTYRSLSPRRPWLFDDIYAVMHFLGFFAAEDFPGGVFSALPPFFARETVLPARVIHPERLYAGLMRAGGILPDGGDGMIIKKRRKAAEKDAARNSPGGAASLPDDCEIRVFIGRDSVLLSSAARSAEAAEELAALTEKDIKRLLSEEE